MKKVIKRNGKIHKFKFKKLKKSILKAGESTGEFGKKEAKSLAVKVRVLLQDMIEDKVVASEEIAEVVEEVLMNKYKHAAKDFILYRDQQQRQAEITSNHMVDLVKQYLHREDWKVNENSNMGYSISGLNNYISSSISKEYWLNNIYPENIREAHKNGDLHIHDLSQLSAYCIGWDLEDLLKTGFCGVRGKTESNPPKHFGAALGQIVNFMFTLQNEAAGAMAFSSFDTLLAPFIYYDKLSYEQVRQNMQEFVFNMNVHTRQGGQCPFTNLTFDLQPSPNYKDQAVIIGGKTKKKTYGKFQKQMNMINKAFLEVMMEGDAKGRIFTFPIPTYNITKDFDWDNPELELLWKCTGKYGMPYFANYINSDMKPEDAKSMCPLSGKEKILHKSTRYSSLEYSSIKNLHSKRKEKYEIYADGKFVKGKIVKYNNQEMIKITLANNHTITMSKNHLNFIKKTKKKKTETIKGLDLKIGDYLPYSLKSYKGNGGNYELGYFVGAYAGDGCYNGSGTVNFSFCEKDKKDLIKKIIKISEKYFGSFYSVNKDKNTKLVSLRIHSKAAAGFCKEFVRNKQRNKHYNPKLYAMSEEFRRGVIDGHYASDGGNRHRIYTSSPKMVESLNMLAVTLGTTTSIYKDDRSGRLGTEPNYAVLIYQLNRKSYADVWFKEDKKLWVKIKEIEEVKGHTAYCFEIQNDKPLFTVGTTGILTHNCRLRLDMTELRKKGGGLFGSNPLTGSIGVVTINMPRLGYLATDREEFIKKLDHLMFLAKESLEIKRKMIEKFTEENLYPYSKFYLRSVKKRFDKYWKNHFSTIGLVGMNEACLNLLGEDIGSYNGRRFASRVLNHMREKMVEFQKETGNNYNLEATPAESTCYSLALKDKKEYDHIVCANEESYREENADPFYTNSSQLPVNYTDDMFELLELQDDLQTKYTGGTVQHLFVGEKIDDYENVKNLIKKVCENFSLPYISLTPTFSICPKCGYLSGEQPKCPTCGKKCEVWSRVVGYLRPVEQWNKGKKSEWDERKNLEEKS